MKEILRKLIALGKMRIISEEQFGFFFLKLKSMTNLSMEHMQLFDR